MVFIEKYKNNNKQKNNDQPDYVEQGQEWTAKDNDSLASLFFFLMKKKHWVV